MKTICTHASMNDHRTEFGKEDHPHPELVVKREMHLLPERAQFLCQLGAPKCPLLRDRVGHEPIHFRRKGFGKLWPLTSIRLQKFRPPCNPLDAFFELFSRSLQRAGLQKIVAVDEGMQRAGSSRKALIERFRLSFVALAHPPREPILMFPDDFN